ncbi:hypothetical protein Ancab_033587 [Ancistrocladus abbreviatus]
MPTKTPNIMPTFFPLLIPLDESFFCSESAVLAWILSGIKDVEGKESPIDGDGTTMEMEIKIESENSLSEKVPMENHYVVIDREILMHSLVEKWLEFQNQQGSRAIKMGILKLQIWQGEERGRKRAK